MFYLSVAVDRNVTSKQIHIRIMRQIAKAESFAFEVRIVLAAENNQRDKPTLLNRDASAFVY